MTAPSLVGKIVDKGILERDLESGEIIEAVARDQQHIEIMIYRMKARERMLLGIPLDPDAMDLADWEALPGIGPKLAKAIMDDRQKYGDLGSFNSLQRVPGVGEEKLKALKRYF
jgi:competence protein ComEA